jgi:hypothetical protein
VTIYCKELFSALPDNSSVNMVKHATIEEAVLSVDPTDAPIYWLDSDHMICVFCRSMSIPRLYSKGDRIRPKQLRESSSGSTST